MKILILLALFISFTLSAQDCSDVLIDTSSMPKNNNQNQHNWCVFWTGADLYSFYEKTPLSSYDMALQYFNNDVVKDESIPDATEYGANMTAALILAQQGKGLCLESQTNYTDSDWMELSFLFQKIASSEKSLKQIVCENNLAGSKPFNEIPANIMDVLDKLSGDKKAAALLDVTCGKRHQVGRYGVGARTIELFAEDKIMEKLDSLLTSNQPASVSYDWDFIINSTDYIKKESNHSSTIIGRRMNPKTGLCEYKIKDSAGNRCPKKAQYECDKETGTLWVPRSNLQKNVYEVNWLTKR